MNRGVASYSASTKPRKITSAKRKKSRESTREKKKDHYNSPGKIMVSKYTPSTSSHTFLHKNTNDELTNLRYAAVRPKNESAFKSLVYSPSGRPISKVKKKTKNALASTFNSLGTKSSILAKPFQKKKSIVHFTKKTENPRSSSYNKRPSSEIVGILGQRSASGSSKRKKIKESPKTSSRLYGYPSTTATSKFLAGKSLSKYASVDHLIDSSKKSLKPSLKLKSSKVFTKQSKNSIMDGLFKNQYLDNELKYSYKGMPASLKVKSKDKVKIK
jgi:hypothetical protein